MPQISREMMESILKNTYLNIYSVLSSLQVLSHLILMTTLWGKYPRFCCCCCSVHWTHKETQMMLRSCFKVRQIVGGTGSTCTQAVRLPKAQAQSAHWLWPCGIPWRPYRKWFGWSGRNLTVWSGQMNQPMIDESWKTITPCVWQLWGVFFCLSQASLRRAE